MNTETVHWLNELNAAFYATVHESFSETRSNHWSGWDALMDLVEAEGLLDGGPHAFSVLDLACGNLRFEKFLLERYPSTAFEFHAVDNCIDLVPQGLPVAFYEQDLVGDLIHETSCESALNDSASFGIHPINLAVSFGFMHHIPAYQNRVRFLKSLLGTLDSGAYAAISFWSFLSNDKLKAKAEVSHSEALDYFENMLGKGSAVPIFQDLEPDDRFVGWAHSSHVYRYCHHFGVEEVSALINEVSDMAELVSMYFADGKTNDLNIYVVLRRV